MFERPNSPEKSAQVMVHADETLKEMRNAIQEANEEIARINASIEKTHEEIARTSDENQIKILGHELLQKRIRLGEWTAALGNAEKTLHAAGEIRDDSEDELSRHVH